jgi:uncharacterized protein YegL
MPQPQVEMRCVMNRQHVKANSPATLFVAIDLKSGGGGQGYAPGAERLPLNIAVAIDCSGSMQTENKFEYAQQAAISLVKSLRPSDTVSIVSFETKARVEVPSLPATDTYRLETSIAAIPLGKETDLYEGLRLAWQQVLPNSGRPGVVSRVILLTDGEPTRGKTKEKDFLKLADEIRQSGIPVTTIGVGTDYKEQLLMNIAQTTGSLWYHVSNPTYMGDIFAEEVTQMARTVVRSPTLSITIHEGNEIVDVYTMRPMVTRLTLPNTSPRFDFRLKDIVAGEDQTVFLRVKVPARPSGDYEIAHVQLGTLSSDLAVTSTDDDKLASVEADPYPRLLWVAGDGLTQVQRWIDGETVARDQVETRMRTLLADQNLPTVARANPNLETAVTQLREVHDEATRLAPGSMGEDDKKRLRRETTVLRKTQSKK